MNLKPRNFDEVIENVLVEKGVCTPDTLNKYSKKEKFYYFNQFLIGATNRRKHPKDEYAFSLYSYERRKHIPRASRFDDMIKDIPLIKKSCNYRADNWSNGYRVTSAGYDIFSACCRAVPSRCGLYNEGKPYNPPRNGIRSQLKNSNKCNVEAKVPKEIPLNEFSLRRYLKRLQQRGNHRNMISQIEYLLTLAKASKSGLLPITYVQSNGGRLYAEGAVNLQNCKREIRKTALAGMFDVDIENCHYNLLEQMCTRIGIKTPRISHYVRNKKQVRKEVATTLQCTEEQAKVVLIALIYGANLGPRGVLKKLDIDTSDEALKDTWISKLTEEITNVRRYVIEDYTARTRGYCKIKNDAGMIVKTITENGESVKKSKLLAHLLHGAESLILQYMISFLGDNVVLLQHDGVTCPNPVDTDELSDYIAEKTGYRVQFDIELLKPDFNVDATDRFQQQDMEDIFEIFKYEMAA
ncbi:hypothetical protein [Enterobacter hormaechei]|uniref:hypothetical protein n=1 Tax=Enterobacter hormaechei TaxID=158836 RepID=UPI0007A85EAF|nr:hypothetical protein [Enterobacter hormaechei]MCM7272315.1 hypothetical protein [Enterobacter hormaechei]SAJ21355.1 Uncharacterised protein [Enterobacter hormaechei]HCA7800917.1 hypothetical protein [Enterobacter hormaechei]